mgnify:CR=1 FL=1
MKRYGIIGNPLGHSYSEKYFTELFVREGIEATYGVYQIDSISSAIPLLASLEGMNVTYPYKEAIIPHLTEMDVAAEEIGAVNVVKRGKGYNTDWIGFRDSLSKLLQPTDQRALLLGSGGVSKAIQYALRELGIEYTVVSRSGYPTSDIGYQDVDKKMIAEHQIVVNCTPLGMKAYENELPDLPYNYLNQKHLLYDCIYNPEKTLFLQKGENQGCRIKNGLEMLHLQADEAWKIWNKI